MLDSCLPTAYAHNLLLFFVWCYNLRERKEGKVSVMLCCATSHQQPHCDQVAML